jgi:hypothetical protein
LLGKLFTEQFAFAQGDSVVVIGLGRFGGAVAQSLMSPSTSSIMRSQRAASRGSWVTIRNEVPALGVHAAHQREHLVGRGGVEVAGGLVGQHQRRLQHQRAGDGHALLHAARQLARPLVHGRARPTAASRRARARAAPR